MDLTSIVGIIAGLSLILSAILLGGTVHNFFNLQGIMIVLGGTISATLLTFRFEEVIGSFQAAFTVFSRQDRNPNDMVETLVKLCNLSRREGLLQLQHIKTESNLLKKACDLIADNAEEDVIRTALRTEIDSLKRQHLMVQDVFRKMGIYSPAFGMLGTLIGLIQMLSSLNDPAKIGPSMAVALLTTFYGSLLSTMIFLPIAGKLKARTIMRVINLEIVFEGAISILNNNNPMAVYEKLSSYVPKKNRKSYRSMTIRQHTNE